MPFRLIRLPIAQAALARLLGVADVDRETGTFAGLWADIKAAEAAGDAATAMPLPVRLAA